MSRISRYSCAALALAPLSLFAAAGMEVYPVPQQIKLGENLTLASGARIHGADTADADSVALLKARLALAASAGDVTEVRIGKVGDAAVKGFDADVPAKSGAYRLVARKGVIALVGHDDRGVFYAVQTLRQLLDADGKPADMPAAEVLDFPVVPYRGIVEGFYDTPEDRWSHEGRLRLLEFSGRNKLDTYIYGPKDDPYHRSRWREPYPAAEGARLGELVKASKHSKVNFVWALHPGGDIKWTESDYQAAKAKFEKMYALGVRSYAVFFDDIHGEGTKAEKQAELLNRLNKEFVQAKPDVTPLILCPTEYNKGWANQKKGGYLDVLGEMLDPSIQVMWTGNTVVSDLDKASMEYINGRLRRKAYIWWNAPCNDFSRRNLNLGPIYSDPSANPAWVNDWAKALGQRVFGNTAEAAELMSGFTSNPMGRSEASKVGLYGVAGYTWNPKAYDALASWEKAMFEIMPNAAEAYRTFCYHNQDNGPNGHGYRRPESVEFKHIAEAYLAAFRAGRIDTASSQKLREEFGRIAAAPEAIRRGADNPLLISEITAWLDAFEQLGATGMSALDAANSADRAVRWSHFAKASAAKAKQNEVDMKNNRNQWQPGIKVGSLVMAPLVDEVLKSVGDGFYLSATGRTPLEFKGVVNRGGAGGIEKMLDSDPTTYYYAERHQEAGDWFGVDLGKAAPVTRVSLLMGRKDGDHDIIKKGQLEYTTDGKTWKSLGPVTTGESVFWEGPAVNASQVRYRALEPQKKWTAIRTFAINPSQSQPKVLTSVANLSGIPVRKDKDWVILTPQYEVHRLDQGKFIGVALPSAVGIRHIELDLAADNPANWATVEISEDGNTWKPVTLAAKGKTGLAGDVSGSARAVRVRNGGSPVDVKISNFKVRLADGDVVASPWIDGRLETFAALPAAGAVLDVPADSRGVTLFFGAEHGAGATVSTATSRNGPWTEAAKVTTDLAEVVIPRGAKFLRVTPATGSSTLHEAVWRK